MDTKSMTTQVRLRHWAGVMQERNASGLSVRAWYQASGVREKTYHYWQRKLHMSAQFYTPGRRDFTVASQKVDTCVVGI